MDSKDRDKSIVCGFFGPPCRLCCIGEVEELKRVSFGDSSFVWCTTDRRREAGQTARSSDDEADETARRRLRGWRMLRLRLPVDKDTVTECPSAGTSDKEELTPRLYLNVSC